MTEIKELAKWSKPKRVNTSNGPRLLSNAPLPAGFWEMWNANKATLRSAGLSVGKHYQTGEWELCWWQPVSVEEQEQLERNILASQQVDANIDIPRPEGLEYRPYQKAGLAFALPNLQFRGILFGDEMGLGKTVEAIGVINAVPTIKKVLVVAPAAVKINWRRELERWLVREFSIGIVNGSDWPGRADICIINYDILGRHLDNIKSTAWDAVIVDEAHYCFTGDTIVETDLGPLRLDKIVNERIECFVLSYDFSHNELSWQPITDWHSFNYSGPIYEIGTRERTVKSTWDHKIATNHGWKEAHSISDQDLLCVLSNGEMGPMEGQKHCKVLQQTMCCNPTNEHFPIKRSYTQVSYEDAVNRMQELWSYISLSFKRQTRESETFLLQSSMCSHTSCSLSRMAKKTVRKIEGSPWLLAREKEQRCIQMVEGKQSNEKSGNCSEDEAKIDRKNISITRRERSTNKRTSDVGKCDQMADGSSGFSKSSEEEFSKPTELLQSGFRQSKTENSNRSRRENSQVEEVEIPRPPKDRGSRIIRMERVEVHKRTSPGKSQSSCSRDQTVYCISVNQTENFFANGILVSNCKNPKTKRAQAIQAAKAPFRMALTGTPIMNQITDIFPVLHWLDPEQFKSIWTFRKKFSNQFGGSTEEQRKKLQKLLRLTLMVRRLKNEVLTELPKMQRQVIEFDPPEGFVEFDREQVKEIDEGLIAQMQADLELAKASDDPKQYGEALSRLTAAQKIAFESMAKVRHQTAVAKIPYTIEHIKQRLEEVDKLVIWFHHRDCGEAFLNAFPGEAVLVYGGLDSVKKDAAVQEFMTNPMTKLFLGSIRATGTGIDGLQKVCQNQIFHELDWVPMVMEQAGARLHRIGQEGSVLSQVLVFSGTIDANMAHACVEKQELADQALDEERDKLLTEPLLPQKKKATHITITKKEVESKILDPGTKAAVLTCLGMIAGMCDGAHQVDGHGFNKFDAHLGRRLASKPNLNDAEALLGQKLVRKYRKQLPEDQTLKNALKTA